MYPKVLQVNAQIDQTLVEDNRVLLNLIRNEARYLPKYPDYFRSVQVEVKPHMRKIVSDWMLEVCQEMHCPPEVFCLAMNTDYSVTLEGIREWELLVLYKL